MPAQTPGVDAQATAQVHARTEAMYQLRRLGWESFSVVPSGRWVTRVNRRG